MKQFEGDIRIYVGRLAAYNNGILHGCWIDGEQDAYAIYNHIRAMLAASPIEDAKEWAIHDYEGFEGVQLSEYECFAEVSKLAAFILEHGEIGGQLVNHLGSLNDAKKAIEDAYAGEYESLADFAKELTEKSTEIPDSLRFYVDFESMARDIEINDVFTIDMETETHTD